MKPQNRYRVTGSLFLLALAVICLPMLLDGAGLPARTLPDLPMDDALPQIQPLDSRVPESDFVARVEELRRAVDDDGFLTDSGTRFGEPVLTPAEDLDARRRDEAAAAQRRTPRTGAGTDVWAVQVASFAEADNAEAFRTRLRRDGYEAFLSTARLDEQVMSRVAVGPVIDRARAETLRGELAARYAVQARLVAFSN